MPAKKPTRKRKPAAKKTQRKRRYRNQVSNPAVASHTDVLVGAGIGIGSYGATRMVGRVAYMVAERKAPKYSRHAYVAATVLGALAIYFASRSVKRVQPYHKAAVVGAVLAAVQSVLKAYFPALSWALEAPSQGDYTQLQPGQPASVLSAPSQTHALKASQPADVHVIEEEVIPPAKDDETFLDMSEAPDKSNVYEFPLAADIG